MQHSPQDLYLTQNSEIVVFFLIVLCVCAWIYLTIQGRRGSFSSSGVTCDTHAAWFQQHSRWVARLPGIWLPIMSVCNRTWTYYLPENHSLIHFIPFGLADRNSVWSHYPSQPLQTDMPPPREWWVGKDCSNFCSVGYSLPASQSDRQPS